MAIGGTLRDIEEATWLASLRDAVTTMETEVVPYDGEVLRNAYVWGAIPVDVFRRNYYRFEHPEMRRSQ